MGAPTDATVAALRDVWWIGGGSGAGKTTIARRVAALTGRTPVSTDDSMHEHASRGDARSMPRLAEFAAMDLDERWLRRDPAVMLDTFHWFHGEGFEHLVDDLVAHPDRPRLVVEGFRLLPARVAALLARRTDAVWLLPTADFRRTAVAARPDDFAFLRRTSDVARATANLLERDRRFTERLREEVRALGLRAIDVDGARDEDGLLADVLAALA